MSLRVIAGERTASPAAAERTACLTGLLAPAGRMALSNYLLQSTVLAWVFTGYGLAAAGQLRPPVVLALALALYAAQLRLSARWMRSHAYGPVEWFLRAVTVLGLPRWRRTRGRHRS